MKTLTWIFTGLVTATFLLVGCSKTEQPATIDTAALVKSFSSAEPTLKASAEKVVSLVKQGNYQSALTELKTLAGNVKLTDEQKKAITDLVAKVQQAVVGTVQKATEGASKAVGDAQKSLTK